MSLDTNLTTDSRTTVEEGFRELGSYELKRKSQENRKRRFGKEDMRIRVIYLNEVNGFLSNYDRGLRTSAGKRAEGFVVKYGKSILEEFPRLKGILRTGGF